MLCETTKDNYFMTYPIYKIKDFCQVGDGAHASIKRGNTGIMYLSSKNFKSHGLDLTNLDYISQSDYEKHFKVSKTAITTPAANDVLLGIIGSIGVPYIVKERDLFGISSSVAILRTQQGLDANYLFHYMKSAFFQQSVDAIKSGAAQGFLSLEMIRNLPLIAPKEDIQQQIAEILSTYDDLIETNNQRIATLEQLAQQIYKEWFVRMRFPGWETTPFHHGIPEGWEIQEIKNFDIQIIDGDRGKNYPSKSEFSETGSCLFLNTGNIQDDKFVFNQCEFISEEKDHQLRKGKLQRGDCVLTTRGTVGNLAYFHHGISIDNIRINSGMIILRCRSGINPQFLYQLLKSQTMKEQYMLYSSGSAQPQLPIRDFNRIKSILPPKIIQEKFSNLMEPIFEQIGTLSAMNEIAILTRNLLLPRLISGKLTIKQAEALAT